MWEVKILFCAPILGTYTHCVSNLEWPVPITNSFALLRAHWDDSSLLALPTYFPRGVIHDHKLTSDCLPQCLAHIHGKEKWLS